MELKPIAETGYIANLSNLVAEIIEGEAIIVHLETGTYYSLRKSAALLWEKLIQGESAGGLLKALEEIYLELPETAEADLRAFLTELEQDGLIIPVEQIKPPTTPKTKTDAGQAGEYSRPIVEKFTDMSDLLLLDPIHEVDEEGWPFKKKTGLG